MAAVGKSSIIKRLVKDFFTEEHVITPSAELESKTFELPRGPVRLDIWDTVPGGVITGLQVGQQNIHSMTKSYFRNSALAIIVFDVTRKPSFLAVSKWIETIRTNVTHDISILVVGNKADKEAE